MMTDSGRILVRHPLSFERFDCEKIKKCSTNFWTGRTCQCQINQTMNHKIKWFISTNSVFSKERDLRMISISMLMINCLLNHSSFEPQGLHLIDNHLILEILYAHQSFRDSSLSLVRRVNERHVRVLIIEAKFENYRMLNLRISMTVLGKTSSFNLTLHMNFHHPI